MGNLQLKFVLFSAYFLIGLMLNSVGTVILQSIESFGVSKADAGILEGFKDLPIALVSFLVASRVPQFGIKRTLIAALIIVATACVGMVVAPSFTFAKILFAAIGTGFALIKITVYVCVGRLTDDADSHASLTNLVEGVFMIGVLSGYWVFSFFIDSSDPGNLVWLNVYWLMSVLSLLLIGLTLSTKFQSTGTYEVEGAPDKDFRAMAGLALKPAVLVFLITAFLYVLIEQSIGTWLPTFNREVLHLPAAMSVQAASIFAAGLALGRLLAGAILQRVSWYWLLNGCVIAMVALVILSLPLAQSAAPMENMTWASAPIAAFVFPLIGVCLAPIFPALSSVILSSLPHQKHASMTGLIIVFAALGGTTGSYVTGQIFERIGGGQAFYMTLLPMAGILVTLWLLKRNISKTESVLS